MLKKIRKIYYYIGECVAKNIYLYYILNYTWGLIFTLFGYVLRVILLPVTNFKIYKYSNDISIPIYYQKLCFNGSFGFSVGTCVFITKDIDLTNIVDEGLLRHEHGHSIQNAIFGPLHLFLVMIPSFIRFWYREIRTKLGYKNKKNYDSIWFEYSASAFGFRY